jgi:YggT family protein
LEHLNNAGSYLVEVVFNLVLYITLTRFWMQWVRADFRNQFGQFIINATNPAILPLRRIVPPIGYVDTATVVLAMLIVIGKVFMLALLLGFQPDWIALMLYCLGELIKASVYIFMFCIFVSIIMSWINPHGYNPVLSTINQLSEPMLASARRIIPSMGGIDFSPILVIIFLNLTLILIVRPLQGG